MKIQNFSFTNKKQNWQIESIEFENLNLLVGASGVGKTRILRALDLVFDIARDENRRLDGVKWKIEFSHLEYTYIWELESSLISEDSISSESNRAEIEYERISRSTLDNGDDYVEILHRTSSEFVLNNKKLPKLKKSESAISLLAEEEEIIPLKKAFNRFVFNETPQNIFVAIQFNPKDISPPENESDSQEFKEALVNLPAVIKAYFIKEFSPEIFEEVIDYYTDIFPHVQDVKINITSEPQGYRVVFEIKEKGLDQWIPQHQISSGMFRTLTCLIDILSAPDNSVIVIDEFENSLGINCMPELTDFMLDKASDLQFILTSHHPYIINNIPWETWQVVSRSGSNIKVRKASGIKELKTASNLDKFTQLVNILDDVEGYLA